MGTASAVMTWGTPPGAGAGLAVALNEGSAVLVRVALGVTLRVGLAEGVLEAVALGVAEPVGVRIGTVAVLVAE